MVSVVVVNWNGVAYLERCLAAVFAQRRRPDEVILVDNHSDDDSRELVAARFPQVEILDTGANLGPAAARNRGVARARGEVVLLLDNDVFLEPDALGAMLATLEADPRAAVVQARSLCEDRPAILHYDAADLQYVGTLALHDWFVARDLARPETRPVGAVIALCLLVRRAAFEKVGGFDEALFILYEDNDLSWKLRMHGHTLWLSTDAIVRHAAGTAGLSFREPGARYAGRRVFLHARNRWLVLLQCARWRTLLLTAPAQMLYAGVYLVFAATRGGLWSACHGHLAALAAVPRALRNRRVQRGRCVPDRDILVALPLTPNPGIADRGWRAGLRRGLDAILVGWWRVVRRLCG